MGKFEDTHIVFHKVQTHKKSILHIDVQEFCSKLKGLVDVWITVGFQTLFLKVYRPKRFQKRQKSKLFDEIKIEEV